ncbi:class I SAM-dependent methyltransferase [Paenibacillus piri]|uniref:Phospholipid methyltransferase n=1 Tax=Paenibacillus piri TaxID=2547395 RepID=A0A4R5KP41_9BACL|nr:methyltransferase [Paenibacillus piri]TDF97062.1 phospholipid methyltransferase [Paenibacillus piri]
MLANAFTKSKITDKWLFLKKFIQNPRDVGSIIPSSHNLTQKMLEPIPWNHVRTLVELGAGTGVFTQSICELVRPDCQVAVFEKEEEMRESLKREFGGFHIFPNALELEISLSSIGVTRADCIVSGLPFANFSQTDREKIIRQVRKTLSAGGMFITFQYSLQMKSMLQHAFNEVSITFVPWNMPPAFVYICK